MDAPWPGANQNKALRRANGTPLKGSWPADRPQLMPALR